MLIFKSLFFVSLLCFVLSEGNDKNGVWPGPNINNVTTVPPTTSTTTTTTLKPSTSTTSQPTTTSKSTTTTSKPTTTTSKPTTTTSKSTTTTTTAKPDTTTTTTPKPTTSTTTTPKPTTSTTTTVKPTTPAPINPVGKWALNYTNTNRTCLVLEGALEVDIFYHVGNSTKNVTVKVPSTATASGTCQDKEENLILSLDVLNKIQFTFKKSNDSKRYDIDFVVVTLNMSLPGLNDTYLAASHNKSEFATPLSSSYKCAKEQALNLTQQSISGNFSGLLKISSFQVQAFRNASSTKFDSAIDCASYETPDVVPIAVGCALAALVLIVLGAYLIGRRRSQARGYLSMFAQTKKEEDYIPMKNLSCFN